jgi:hypothetical protein
VFLTPRECPLQLRVSARLRDGSGRDRLGSGGLGFLGLLGCTACTAQDRRAGPERVA